MKRQDSILKFEIFSTIFTFILGTLLHFTFKWFNSNPLIGIFSAVNESTWEHLKLLFFPMLITTIIGYFYYKDTIPNYLCSKTKGIMIALLFIIIFFYTYTGIIGSNIAVLNIGSFFAAVIIGEYYAYKKIQDNSQCNNLTSIIILSILCICFIIFTFFPPHIGIFLDPITEKFGI